MLQDLKTKRKTTKEKHKSWEIQDLPLPSTIETAWKRSITRFSKILSYFLKPGNDGPTVAVGIFRVVVDRSGKLHCPCWRPKSLRQTKLRWEAWDIQWFSHLQNGTAYFGSKVLRFESCGVSQIQGVVFWPWTSWARTTSRSLWCRVQFQLTSAPGGGRSGRMQQCSGGICGFRLLLGCQATEERGMHCGLGSLSQL